MSITDLKAFNEQMRSLPQAAATLVPDDPILPFLTSQIKDVTTEDEAKDMTRLLCLVSRRLAIVFDDMAEQMEKALVDA